MKTKSFILFAVLFAFLANAFVATAQDDDDVPMDDKIKAMRVGLITQNLDLTSDEATKFFPIYNEFSDEKEKIKEEIKSLHRQMRSQTSNDLEKTMIRIFDLKEQEIKLERTYFNKFKKVISVQKIAKLHQTERQFRRMLLKELSQRGGQGRGGNRGRGRFGG